MKKLIIIGAAAAAALVPAAIGLAGNPSLSKQVVVPAAEVSQANERQQSNEPGDDRDRHELEPGDDHGRELEPGDDHGGAVEPGDDRGGARTDGGHGGWDDGSGHH